MRSHLRALQIEKRKKENSSNKILNEKIKKKKKNPNTEHGSQLTEKQSNLKFTLVIALLRTRTFNVVTRTTYKLQIDSSTILFSISFFFFVHSVFFLKSFSEHLRPPIITWALKHYSIEFQWILNCKVHQWLIFFFFCFLCLF